MTRIHDAGPMDDAPLGTGEEVPATSFVSAIPFRFELSDDGLHMQGDARIPDELRAVDSRLPRASVLATIADCIAGIPACLVTAPRLAVTLDIAVRLVAEPRGDDLTLEGEIVKQGRSTVASEVRFSDAQTDQLVASSYVTFMASPRPQDQAPPLLKGMQTLGSMPVALPDYVGARITRPGEVEVDLTRFVMQASSSLQGGVVALVGEMAAESLCRSPVLDLDIRYLSAVRVGPARATARRLSRDTVRVEVRDLGNDDRLAALTFLRVAPGGPGQD
jgi:acyl-coenzyme A thioesterase PaaI-like protein